MRGTLPWPFLLAVLFGVCVAPNAWGWAELFDRVGGVKPVGRMVDLHQLIETEARRNRLPADFIASIVQIESSSQPCAISRVGAAGLGQLMPATAARYGVSDRFQPIANMRATTAHLAETMRLANGDRRLAAAIYNAGEKVMHLPPSRWPRETKEYVYRRLPRTLSVYQGDGWRRHLPRYVPHVDRYDCLVVRSN